MKISFYLNKKDSKKFQRQMKISFYLNKKNSKKFQRQIISRNKKTINQNNKLKLN